MNLNKRARSVKEGTEVLLFCSSEGKMCEDYFIFCHFLSHRDTANPDITLPPKVIKARDDCVPTLQAVVSVCVYKCCTLWLRDY